MGWAGRRDSTGLGNIMGRQGWEWCCACEPSEQTGRPNIGPRSILFIGSPLSLCERSRIFNLNLKLHQETCG